MTLTVYRQGYSLLNSVYMRPNSYENFCALQVTYLLTQLLTYIY